MHAKKQKIWDPFLRIFHWLLAALIITNYLLGEFGPSNMWLHFYVGYATIALIGFRIIWGFIGPEHARFANFIRGPKAIADYAKHLPHPHPSHWPGHNPMGALSVIAFLGVIIWQVSTGLISDPEDFINVGPFASAVPHDIATEATSWHETGSKIILALIILHVAIIAFYRFWKNENLVKPMITGWKYVRPRK